MEDFDFVVATGNKGKLKEINDILSRIGYRCVAISDLGISLEDEETGKTFLENARIKANEARRKTGKPVIADDSGLMVDSLGGAPGVHTARYAGENADSDANMDKLLKELGDLPVEKRSARFVSTIVCILDDGTEIDSVGTLEGYIGFDRIGHHGFGYNPVFRLRTGEGLAEIPDARRYTITHRGRALRKLEFKLKGIKRIKL